MIQLHNHHNMTPAGQKKSMDQYIDRFINLNFFFLIKFRQFLHQSGPVRISQRETASTMTKHLVAKL